MRLGIATPVVSLNYQRPRWEREAGVEAVVRIAQRADDLGYHHLSMPDHVAVPAGLPRGEQFWNPVAGFSYLAALTRRIRFLTHVVVVPLYHPLEVAKTYSMVDMLSGGRLILGLGVGDLKEEFDALDRPFEGRGERCDDALRALRAVMGSRLASYAGSHYRFTDLVVAPPAVQERVPFWIGGHSRRALRRALELGDGWAPPPSGFRGPSADGIRAMLDEHEIPEGFAVFTTTETMDAVSRPGEALEHIQRLADAGVTAVNVKFVHASLTQYLEQLEAFAELMKLDSTAAG